MRAYLALFVLVFFAIEIADALLPFSALSSPVNYYLLSAFFFLSVAIGSALATALVRDDIIIRRCVWNKHINNMQGSQLALMLSFLGMLGFIFIAYDRIYIQSIDYSSGFSEAREQWRAVSQSREGVSSFFSVAGNLLYNLSFLSLITLVLFWEEVKRKKASLIISILSVISFSLMIGGRTSVLVMVSSVISAICLRKISIGKNYIPKNFSKYVIAILFFALCIGYVVFVFRIGGSPVDGEAYVDSLAARLLGKRDAVGYIVNDPPLNALLIYIAHVKWVAVDIINASVSTGLATFNQFLTILATRVSGLSELKNFIYWEYDGLWAPFLSLVKYDLGFFGAIIVFIFSGLLFFFGSLVAKYSYIGRPSVYLLMIQSLLYAAFFMAPFCFMFEIVEYIYAFIFSIFLLTISQLGVSLRELTRLVTV